MLTKAAFEPIHTIEAIYTGGRVLMTHDNTALVTVSGEDVIVTDRATGRQRVKLSGDSELVTAVAVHPTRPLIVTASRSLSLTTWDADTGTIVRTWRALHQAAVLCMAFDPTGTLLATGSADSTVRLWDIEHAACTHNLRGHSGIVSALLFHPHPDRWTLFSAADDGNVRAWDLLSKECIAVLSGHASVVRALDISQDGNTLVSGARDNIVNVWQITPDMKQSRLLRSVPVFEGIESMALLSNNHLEKFGMSTDHLVAVTAGEKGQLKLWDMETAECLNAEPQPLTEQSYVDMIFLPEEQKILTASSLQDIVFHSLENNFPAIDTIPGYLSEVIDLRFLGPKQGHLAIVSNSDTIRISNMHQSGWSEIRGHTDIILAMDSTGWFDKEWVITGSKDKTARIWELALSDNGKLTSRCIALCVGHAEAVGAVAIGRKHMHYAVTGSADRTVKRWDLKTLMQKDGEDRAKAAFTIKAHDKDINCIAISPNDRFFATGSQDRTAKLWDMEDGSMITEFKGHRRGVWCVQFSPVDQVLATSSGDKTIKLWSLADHSCLRTFEGHTNSVLRVLFLTQGTQLFSTGSDGLSKLWNIKTNDCIATYEEHQDKIWACTSRDPLEPTSPCYESDESKRNNEDVCMVATGSGSGQVIVYADVTAKALQQAQEEAEKTVVQEQTLHNFIQMKSWRRALMAALDMGRSGHVLKVISESLKQSTYDSPAILGSQDVDDAVSSLSDTYLAKLLTYVRDWNTNATYASTAHAVLNVIFKSYPVARLVKLPNMKELSEALVSYSERHYVRLDRMMTDAWLVDYTLQNMTAMVGEVIEAAEFNME